MVQTTEIISHQSNLRQQKMHLRIRFKSLLMDMMHLNIFSSNHRLLLRITRPKGLGMRLIYYVYKLILTCAFCASEQYSITIIQLHMLGQSHELYQESIIYSYELLVILKFMCPLCMWYIYVHRIYITWCTFFKILCAANDESDDDELSTGVAVAISIVVTFIITLVVTALITSLYYKYQYELKEKVKVDDDNTKHTNNSIPMDTNPAYGTTRYHQNGYQPSLCYYYFSLILKVLQVGS